ncbi:MAG: lysine--tRNA ligase [Actinobacteria bacterium]|uniref:lysine--tRNA ligase n=1 Tax=freshwater metagenome TaxID=449393 RepID=A0A6J6MEQ4_9ZZZZ|nr:lysine--tRNA ligase [Actinomycetota bacterium]
MTDQLENDSEDLPEQIAVRMAKREKLNDLSDAYPVSLPITHTISEVRAEFPELEIDVATGKHVALAGRVVFARNTGKLCFATLQSGDGERIQAMVSLDKVGEESLEQYKELVDLGDHLFVEGEVITSKRGELSILVSSWKMAAKTIRPLPNLHNDLSEEFRVRHRYIDLIVRDRAREVVKIRSQVMQSLRKTFAADSYLEVETPMLQSMHGGASARPFKTHMNAFDMELFLRIAPELFLKRAVVGGLERVFEINRNFRNEGADSTHSPEFAMLESYQAYGDYNTMAELTQKLIQNAAQDVFGTQVVKIEDGEENDLSGTWDRISMFESLSAAAGVEITPETPMAELKKIADKVEIEIDHPLHGKYVEELWEHFVKPGLKSPTFVMDFPVDTSPLTRDHRDKPGVVEKWDLYIRGYEQATGYSELVDPVIQRERFVAQMALAKSGDPEAMKLDEEFLKALEFGMPPSGGMGMGIDRLLMSLTGLGIRETILFPLVK